MSKEYYEYFIPGTYEQVSLPKASLVQRIFCKHKMVPLVRRRRDETIFPMRGDPIQYVCAKCGGFGGTGFFEFDSCGYK